jgi:hypothetical protein
MASGVDFIASSVLVATLLTSSVTMACSHEKTGLVH